MESLQSIQQQGARLVITVDCWNFSLEEVGSSAAYGYTHTIIIHRAPEPPKAYALINPKIQSTILSGAGRCRSSC